MATAQAKAQVATQCSQIGVSPPAALRLFPRLDEEGLRLAEDRPEDPLFFTVPFFVTYAPVSESL